MSVTAITFGDVVKDLEVGARLSRTDSDSSVHYGLWTGTVSEGMSLVFDQTTKTLKWVSLDAESIWTSAPVAGGIVAYGNQDTVIDLLTVVSAKTLASQANRRLYNEAVSELSLFKSNAQEALVDWAEGNLDDASSDWSSFSEVLEEIGLEGLKKTYRVEVTVSYNISLEIEASSEDAAREIFEEDSTSFIEDNIDVSYVDDYTVDSVERA